MDVNSKKIARLKGKVQHYAWGGTEYIPRLLGMQANGQPFAEYWLGAHQSAPAEIIDEEGNISLPELIATDPARIIGEDVNKSFGRLPYLLKVLDVKDMLSIQVHPSKLAAEREFARENQQGIALTDSRRNYKDDNHKPELLVALDDFWLLHGFKAHDQLIAMLQTVPELQGFVPMFEEGGYETLYRHLMQLPQEQVNQVLQPLLDRIIPQYQAGSLNRSQEDFWAARAALTFSRGNNIDRGIFSIYLLNLVQLQKGEAVFQDAGILHAYLEGPNVEIMANSDNVLRGGLTPKNIDIEELMKHVIFEPVDPWIIQGTMEKGQRVYKTPAHDFELSSFELPGGQENSFETATADIILLVNGLLQLECGGETLALKTGESAVILPGQPVNMRSLDDALLFRASVPVHNT
jgi:mannose-6-phosphate isomerase